MIKLIACDLDGTLLNSRHELSDENAKAIQRLQAAGIEFLAATGRNAASVHCLLLPYAIHCDKLLLNGSLILDDKGSVLYEVPMPLYLVEQIIQMIGDAQISLTLYTKEGNVTPHIALAKEQFLLHLIHTGLSREEALHVMKKNAFCEYHREVKDLQAYINEQPNIYKMEIFCGDSGVHQRLREALEELPALAISNSIANNIEITATAAQKGNALQAYCRRRAILASQVVVIGDSMNDLSMMELFDHSVAVGNAEMKIQQAASYITKTNDENAVVYIIEKILKTCKE